MYAQWGTFTKESSLPRCLGYAQDAMTQKGFTIWDSASDGDYQVIGGNNDVIATVVCVPQSGNLWVSVSAYSDNSVLAEGTRNDIRTHIVNTVMLDDNS